MEIKRLKSEIIAQIRSPSTLSNVSQCVTELALNSLDAKSTAIALRVNLITFRLQVVDNGEGITKENMELAGLRYMTNKCNSLEQLAKQVKSYGFRGETLASIIDMSKTVEITSKYKHSSQTYSKSFGARSTSEVKVAKSRPSCGTTVTIDGFFYNLPIRRNRIVPELELEDIKKNMEYLIIIHPNVSFSIRNDVTGQLILNSKKNKDIISSFKYLHPKVDGEHSLMKVSKLKVTVEALLFKGLFENKFLQYVYVNKRPVHCSKIQKFVASLYYKNQTHGKSLNNLIVCPRNKYPAYVLNIKCPHSDVDILLNPSKTMVQFKNLNTVLCCLEKLIYSFFGTKKVTSERLLVTKRVKSECGVSQMCGAYKAYGYKRRVQEKASFVPEKVRKMSPGNVAISDIIEETQFNARENNSFRTEVGNDVNKSDSQVLFPDISLDCVNDNKSVKRVSQNEEGNDVYSISDFTGVTARKLKEFKEPLPIKITHKSKKIIKKPKPKIKLLYSNMKISPYKNIPEDFGEDEKNPANTKSDKSIKSLYSRFTDDENKGKNLIMDMFLKSTQIYNSEEDIQSDAKSEETLFEVESNFFMENNFQTNVKGLSKTMSVSVNIKSTKKIRKPKFKPSKKPSKYVQTSLVNNKMVSKCIQTSIEQNSVKLPQIIEPENYTIVFSDTVRSKKTSQLKFVVKQAPTFDFKPNYDIIKSNCECGCHLRKNIFSFDKVRNGKTNDLPSPSGILNKTIDFNVSDNSNLEENSVSPIKFLSSHRDGLKNLACATKKADRCLFPIRNQILNKRHKSDKENIFGGDKSPYFSSEKRRKNKLLDSMPRLVKPVTPDQLWNESNRLTSYELFNPRYRSTQLNQTQGGTKNPNEELNTLDDFTIENFGQFQPFYKSTQRIPDRNLIYNPEYSKYPPSSNHIFQEHTQHGFKSQDLMNVSEYIQQNDFALKGQAYATPYVRPLLLNESLAIEGIKPSDERSKLVITLSNKEREDMLQRELNAEKDFNKKIFLDWDSQTMGLDKESQELTGGWVKKLNKFGSNFYINKRTGFTTFFTPKPDSNQFKLDRRLEFMPKGLSPIMKDFKEVDQSLSQNKKDLLQNYILESHQDDLLVVKWQNYIKNNDPKRFFEEVYKEKARNFGECIPSITTINNKKCLELDGIISFNKDLFNNITVIGQVDRKFIATLEKTKNLIILFDQHAVHERIRLERLLKVYAGAKVECLDKFILFMPQNDLSLLKKHESYLNSLGLSVEFFENGVTLSEIPLCLYNKFKNNCHINSLNKVVQLFVNEIIGLLKVTRGVSVKNLPPIMQNIINLEACRGAIKFGDSLNMEECIELLGKLADCKLPFQCAHGRPTLTPLLTLDLPTKIVSQRLNLKKIKVQFL